MMTSPRDTSRYGESPVEVGQWSGERFIELMHWLYLPLHLPERFSLNAQLKLTVPQQLRRQGIEEFVETVMEDYGPYADWKSKYVYVTVRRGFATPDNPLNRTGWHTDGFGTDDTNYIWSDAYPTRWLDSPNGIGDPSEDHLTSLEYFEARVRHASYDWYSSVRPTIREVSSNTIYRLSPYVVHATPLVPSPGGMRSWIKVSISEHKYNLIGNSHNWDLDYDWEMVDRNTLRNDPAAAQNDFVAS